MMSHDEGRSYSERLNRRTVMVTAAAAAVALPFSALASTSARPHVVPDGGGVSFGRRTVTTKRHSTAYVEAGPANGPLIFFLHGDSEQGIIWRSQVEHFAAGGWHCVAPDMRGHGGSDKPEGHEAYAIREIVTDMAELHDMLGGAPAVWVGHDSGSPIVWQLAATERQRCRAVANLNLPYFPAGSGPISAVPHVDRRFSPLDRYLLGQRDHMQFYAGSAVEARRDGETSAVTLPATPVDAGQAAEVGKAGRNSTGRAADPSSWYRNEAANHAYAQEAPNGGRLTLPVLYFHARHDTVVDTTNSRLAEPMRTACADLTEETFSACRCLPTEHAHEVNGAIENWLAAKRIS